MNITTAQWREIESEAADIYDAGGGYYEIVAFTIKQLGITIDGQPMQKLGFGYTHYPTGIIAEGIAKTL